MISLSLKTTGHREAGSWGCGCQEMQLPVLKSTGDCPGTGPRRAREELQKLGRTSQSSAEDKGAGKSRKHAGSPCTAGIPNLKGLHLALIVHCSVVGGSLTGADAHPPVCLLLLGEQSLSLQLCKGNSKGTQRRGNPASDSLQEPVEVNREGESSGCWNCGQHKGAFRLPLDVMPSQCRGLAVCLGFGSSPWSLRLSFSLI